MQQARKLVLCLVTGALMVGLFPVSAQAESPAEPSLNPASQTAAAPEHLPPETSSEPSEVPSQAPSDSPVTPSTMIGVDKTASGVELTDLAVETNTEAYTDVIAHALADATGPFSLFALSWVSLPANAEARVRTLADSGWTDWLEIHVSVGESLVGADSRQSSEAMWVGISHGFELEITGAGEATDVQVTLVNPAASLNILNTQTQASKAIESPSGYVQQPTMVSRASWGAMAQDDCGMELYDGTIVAVSIHHTAGSNDYGASDVPGILRSIQAYHEVTLKWCDIGYNFLVDKFGTIYEGRGGGISIPIHGAHSGEWNSNTTGIAMMMNTETYDPSTAVVDSVAKVAAWKLANNYRDPLGVVTIANKTINVIFGHGDVQATACPGKYMKAKMASLRTQVAALVNAAQPSPIKAKWEEMGVSLVGQPYHLESSIGTGRFTAFTSGYRIFWSAATGAVPVWVPGAMGSYYIANSGPLGALGFPVDAEARLADGTSYQAFEKGWLTWTEVGGIVVQDSEGGRLPGALVTGVLLSGQVALGSTLTAKVTVIPTDATLSYQWLRDGKPISGATDPTRTVTGADMCHSLSVKVSTEFGSKTSASVTPGFSDVSSGHTFYSSICWAANKGVTTGTAVEGTYSPSNPVNRGAMAQFLYRLAGSPSWTAPTVSPFVDVPTSHQFYSAITWLYSQRVTVGVVVNGKVYYQPANTVNRGSMSVFMYRLAGKPAWAAPVSSPFADVAKTHDFYSTITWLANQKITVGSTVDGKFVYQPANAVNRGSMAAFMQRLTKTQLQCGTYANAVGCE